MLLCSHPDLKSQSFSTPTFFHSSFVFFFFRFIHLFIFGCAGFLLLPHALSLVAESRGYLLVVVRRLLIVAASLAAEHRQAPGMRTSGAEA